MYSIEQRREIANRIANPSDIPAYRQLLQQTGNPFAGQILLNEKKLAVFLVSALLSSFTEEEIIQATKGAPAAKQTAFTSNSASIADAAVKKNALKSKNIRGFIGKILTTPWSGQQILSFPMRSILADGSVKLKRIFTARKQTRS